MVNQSTRINQTSGIVEYFTPREIVNCGRDVMGGIDLDVASCDLANEEIVMADSYYSEPSFSVVRYITSFYESNAGIVPEEVTMPVRQYVGRGALDYDWSGRVFMNPPFRIREVACKDNCTKVICRKRGYHLEDGIDGIESWVSHLVEQYKIGNITEAIAITFANTSEDWFKPLLPFSKCWLYGRTKYIEPSTMKPAATPPKGSVVHYLGDNLSLFHQEFRHMGRVQADIETLLGFKA